MGAIHLSKADFLNRVHNYETNGGNWHFEGDKPMLLDFYASWCGPCKALSPVIDSLADEYAGRVDVYKVNIDEEEELAAFFGVRSIPTLVFASPTEEPKISVGAMSRDALKATLDNLLG